MRVRVGPKPLALTLYGHLRPNAMDATVLTLCALVAHKAQEQDKVVAHLRLVH